MMDIPAEFVHIHETSLWLDPADGLSRLRAPEQISLAQLTTELLADGHFFNRFDSFRQYQHAELLGHLSQRLS